MGRRHKDRYDIFLPTLDQRMLTNLFWRYLKRDPAHEQSLAKIEVEYLMEPRRVFWDSPVSMRKAVEQMARYFRIEFGYDFVQYGWNEEPSDDVAFLWTDDNLRYRIYVTGACCFRWREWRDGPPSWSLSWVWMHPFVRRQGLLTRAWPYFEARFGRFHVETPWSPSMWQFLLSRKHWMTMQPWPRQPEPTLTIPPLAAKRARATRVLAEMRITIEERAGRYGCPWCAHRYRERELVLDHIVDSHLGNVEEQR